MANKLRSQTTNYIPCQEDSRDIEWNEVPFVLRKFTKLPRGHEHSWKEFAALGDEKSNKAFKERENKIAEGLLCE